MTTRKKTSRPSKKPVRPRKTPRRPTAQDLTLDPKNANLGTARGRAMLAKSLETYGAGRSIVTDKHSTILAGNKTAEAARRAGLPITIVETTGEELVVVRRTDLDLDTDAAARELAYADNRVAEVDLQWDPARLADGMETASAEDLNAFWTPAEQAGLRGETPPAAAPKVLGSQAVATEIVLHFDAAQAGRWAAWMRQLVDRYPGADTIAARIDAALADWTPPEEA